MAINPLLLTELVPPAQQGVASLPASGAAVDMSGIAAPTFDPFAYQDQLNKSQLKRLQDYASTISSGNTLTSGQQQNLAKLSGLIGQDLASTLSYTPTSDKYTRQLSKYDLPPIASTIAADTTLTDVAPGVDTTVDIGAGAGVDTGAGRAGVSDIGVNAGVDTGVGAGTDTTTDVVARPYSFDPTRLAALEQQFIDISNARLAGMDLAKVAPQYNMTPQQFIDYHIGVAKDKATNALLDELAQDYSGRSREELETELQYWKDNPPVTQDELLRARGTWREYSTRPTQWTDELVRTGVKGIDYSLQPRIFLPTQFSEEEYGVVASKLLNNLSQKASEQSASGFMNSYIHELNAIKEIEDYAKKSPEAFKLIDEFAAIDPKIASMDPQSLMSMIRGYAETLSTSRHPWANIQEFIKWHQRHVGIGTDDWFGSQNMGNEQYAAFQKMLNSAAPLVDDNRWVSNAMRHASPNNNFVDTWRDPTSGAGLAIAVHGPTNTPQFMWMNREGVGQFSTSYSAPDMLAAAEKMGIDISRLGELQDTLDRLGVDTVGNDYADLARGGFGTSYDWTEDPLVQYKGPYAQQQLDENKRLAERFGLKAGAKKPSEQFTSQVQEITSPYVSMAGRKEAADAADSMDAAVDAVSDTGPTWSASYNDMFEFLKPGEEKRLDRLADLYRSGDLEGREKRVKELEKLISKGDLGTLESFFSTETPEYTAPTGLNIRLPEGISVADLAEIFRTADPMKAYVTAEQLKLSDQDIAQLMSGYAPNYYNQRQSIDEIQDLLSEGKMDAFDFGLTQAYIANPNDPRFLSNPALAERAQQNIIAYDNPIEEPITSMTTDRRGREIAGSGQYDYINNAPVLNASVVESFFDEAGKNKIGMSVLKKDPELAAQLGWNIRSGEDLAFIQKGTRVVGVNETSYTPDKLERLDAQAEAGGTTDSEGNFVEFRMPRALVKAAEKLGLDPAEYDRPSDLYNEIERATQGMYQVVGGYKNQWDADEIAQIDDKGNHAGVMYREVNGMLIPISQPNLFKYEKPSKPLIGGTIGNILGSVPFLPEIAAIATGGNPYVYTGLKTAQAASRSGDLGDIALTAGISWFAPKVFEQVAGGISDLLPDNMNPLLAEFVTKAGTSAVMGGGLAALTGQDVDFADIIADSIIGTGIEMGAGQVVKLTDLPANYQKIAARAIADLLRGQDIEKIIQNAALRGAFTAFKDRDTAVVGGGG